MKLHALAIKKFKSVEGEEQCKQMKERKPLLFTGRIASIKFVLMPFKTSLAFISGGHL